MGEGKQSLTCHPLRNKLNGLYRNNESQVSSQVLPVGFLLLRYSVSFTVESLSWLYLLFIY